MKDLTKKQAEHLRHVGELAKALLRQQGRKGYYECVSLLTDYVVDLLSESDIPYTPVMKMIWAVIDDYLFKDKEERPQCRNCNYCKYPRTTDDNGGACKCKPMKYKTIDILVESNASPVWCPLQAMEVRR